VQPPRTDIRIGLVVAINRIGFRRYKCHLNQGWRVVTLGLKTAFSRDASGFRFGWRLGASDETGKMNRFAKFSLVATSIAPVFLTMWFVEFSRGWNWLDGWEYLALTLLLTVLCWVLLQMVRTRLDVLNLEIVSVKTADNEMI